jgi:hypothetical protein
VCGQTFTRNTSGKRHNLNLHSGLSQIVNSTEYYVGRINGKYTPPSNSPSSFRRKKSFETRILDVQDKQQQQQQQQPNNPYTLIPNLSNIKNNNFYDVYNNTITNSKDEFSFNNFFFDNAADIYSIIEEYQYKLQPYLYKEEINQFIKNFIIIPLISYINTKEKFLLYKKQLDNVCGFIRICKYMT